MEEKLTTLASLPYSKAEILSSILEAEGIDSFLEKVDFLQNGMDTGVMFGSMKWIFVRHSPSWKRCWERKPGTCQTENYVLVPVDFSSYSLKAALVAFDIAEKIGSKMVMYHSSLQPEFLTIPYSDVIVYDSALFLNYEMTEKETIKKFEDFLSKLTSLIDYNRWKKAKPEYIIKVGEPEDDILSYIHIHPPKLVVMGIRGGDAESDDLIGTTTAGVIFNAKVPVLAIPEKTPDNWLENFHKIAYATIFESNDFIAIDRLLKLMTPFDTKVICVHVDQGNNPLLMSYAGRDERSPV